MQDIEDLCSPVSDKISPHFSTRTKRQQNRANSRPLAKKAAAAGKKKAAAVTEQLVAEPQPAETTQSNSNTWEPRNWQQTLENLRKMRANKDAPVDTMGCEECSDKKADPRERRFHILVSLMLSSQTKDEITHQAVQRLREHVLTPESLVNMQLDKLQELLKPVSFYKRKAEYLQKASKILIEKHNSCIPHTIKELTALPGVGPKMAHICMSAAWNEVTGIGVDVHVHRIANRLGWVEKETKIPEHTRLGMEKWMPRELWDDINLLLVGFGQTICKAIRPQCGVCLNKSTCPWAAANYKEKKTPGPSPPKKARKNKQEKSG